MQQLVVSGEKGLVEASGILPQRGAIQVSTKSGGL